MKNYNPYEPNGLTYDEWFYLQEEEFINNSVGVPSGN